MSLPVTTVVPRPSDEINVNPDSVVATIKQPIDPSNIGGSRELILLCGNGVMFKMPFEKFEGSPLEDYTKKKFLRLTKD